MRHLKAKTISMALAVCPIPALAAEWAQGTLSLGYFTTDDTEAGFLFGDFTLRLEKNAWGGEVGMFGVVGRLHETYAAVTYDMPVGRLSFGFPRPAYDDFARPALTDVLPRVSLKSVGATHSRTTYGTMTLQKFLPYGVRYASEYGALQYTLSLHGVPDYSDVVAGGGLGWAQGAYSADIAVEAVMQDAATQWNAKAQVVGDFGAVSVGVGLFDGAANDHPRLVEAFARYNVLPGTDLTGLARFEALGDPAFGLGVTQQITSGLSVKAGVFGMTQEDLSAGASLQFQF